MKSEEQLRKIIAELVEIMERSAQEEFGDDVPPVTSGEWFAAINRAKSQLLKLEFPGRGRESRLTSTGRWRDE